MATDMVVLEQTNEIGKMQGNENGCCKGGGPGYATPIEAMSGPRERLIYVTCVYSGKSYLLLFIIHNLFLSLFFLVFFLFYNSLICLIPLISVKITLIILIKKIISFYCLVSFSYGFFKSIHILYYIVIIQHKI